MFICHGERGHNHGFLRKPHSEQTRYAQCRTGYFLARFAGYLNRRRGQIEKMEPRPGGAQVVTAYVPLSEMFGYTTDLRSATQGRATSTMHFERYDQAPKNVAEEVIAKVQGVASK